MRVRALLVALALIAGSAIVVAPAAYAATDYTWTGAANDGKWSDANNWSPHGVPGTGAGAGLDDASVVACGLTITDVPVASLDLFNYGPSSGGCSLDIASGGTISVADLTWNGGEIDTDLQVTDGDISPDEGSPSPTTIGGALVVSGQLDLDDNAVSDNGQLLMSYESEIVVSSGAELVANGDNDILDNDGCTNQGIDNQGTLDVHDGTLLLTVPLSQTRVLKTDDSSSNVIDNNGCSTNHSGSGASYTGPGSLDIAGSEAGYTLSGTQTLSNGFQLVLGGDPAGTFSGSDGTETLTGDFTLGGAGEFDWIGGTLAADATLGHGIDTYVDPVSPPSGYPADGLDLDGTDSHQVRTPVTNDGSMVFEHSPHVLANGNPRIYNKSDGHVYVSGGTLIDGEGALGNQGELQITPGTTDSDGTDVTFDNFALVNSGRVDVAMDSSAAFDVPSMTNSGTVMVSDGTFEDDTDYKQTAGKTTVTTLTKLDIYNSHYAVKLYGGEVTGDGRIDGAVINAGATIAPSHVRPLIFTVVPDSAHAASDPIPDAIGRLSIYGAYTGGSKSRLVADVDSAKVFDVLAVHGNASVRGTLVGHNLHTPSSAWKPTPVIATGTLSASLSCVATSGPGSTGSAARHWTPSVHGHYLYLYSIAGSRTSC